MSKAAHWHPADLHGLSRLAVDGVLGTTSLVEQVHHAIARVSGPTLPSRNGRTRGITGLVYRSIHGITGLVGTTTDLAFGQIVPRLRAAQSTPQRDRALAVLNGVLGDHLAATANPLALGMSLRHAGSALANDPIELALRFPNPQPKLAIFLHGLCMSDHHWTPTEGEDAGVDLPRQLSESAGYLPLHFYYNSGRAIASNGQDLAQQLEALSRNWPVRINEMVLIGHSMGGLLGRSALHHAALHQHSWLEHTHRLITLGSPHHGAPLERIGHKVDQALALTPFSAPFARLGRIRSAGITDLRFGHLIEPGARLVQPRHVRMYAVAATLADAAEALKSRTIGDGLVPVSSALGRQLPADQQPARECQKIVTQTGHLRLLHHPEVADQICDWLQRD